MSFAAILHVRTMTKTELGRHNHFIVGFVVSIFPSKVPHPQVLPPILIKTRYQLHDFPLFRAAAEPQWLLLCQ
jgi:hypothetical protein